jgi:hypothetical protein
MQFMSLARARSTHSIQISMAATSKNQAVIDQVKRGVTEVPWCDEFEKMVSGMKYISQTLFADLC